MVRIDHILLIHSSVDGRLDFPHFWAIVSNAAVNTRVHVLVWTPAFISVGSALPRSGVTGSHGNSKFHVFEELSHSSPKHLLSCFSGGT